MWEEPWNGGRGHWGKAFSVLVAGGGFKGGHVIGRTDARGEEVTENPVQPVELLGSIYGNLGIAADARLPHPEGSDVRVMPAASEATPHSRALEDILAAPQIA